MTPRCPKCHKYAVKVLYLLTIVEVSCLHCGHHRSFATTLDFDQSNWRSGL